MIDKHDLHHEFPEYFDRIHELNMTIARSDRIVQHPINATP